MSEDARTCKACGFKWFAKRRNKPQSPRGAGSFYALGGHHGAAAARATTASTKYESSMNDYRRWKDCPNCGSSKVKSVGKRGFEPTGAIVSRPQASKSEKRKSRRSRAETASAALPTKSLPPPPTPEEPTTSDSGYLVELRELASLRREGLLTDEEFETQKRRLLP